MPPAPAPRGTQHTQSQRPLCAIILLLICVLALVLTSPRTDIVIAPLLSSGGVAPASRAAKPPPKGVVLTLASNMRDFGGLQRFVASLRKHSPTTRTIVVFTDAASLEREPRLKTLFSMFDVTVQLFELASDMPTFSFGAQLAWTDLYRWILYNKWLKATNDAACDAAAGRGAPLEGPRAWEGVGAGAAAGGGSGAASGSAAGPRGCAPGTAPPQAPYDYVMFSDSRDLLFQSDVFAALQAFEGGGEGFYPVMESVHDTVGGSEYNARWVEGCYGREGLKRIQDEVVSCSGTSLGAWADALAYSSLMVETMTAKAAPDCLWADQGMHNYLLHTGAIAERVSAVHKVSHEDGFLVSLGTTPTFQIDHWGRVLNAAGALAAAVHQYDRWPRLKGALETLYPWITDDDRYIHQPPPPQRRR